MFPLSFAVSGLNSTFFLFVVVVNYFVTILKKVDLEFITADIQKTLESSAQVQTCLRNA